MKNKIIISKDALRADALSCYGGKIWQTPNIDRLASEGTLFRRHYTTAPSTAMAITSMFSGLYPYELDRQDYREVPQFSNQTLFDEFHKRGYRTAVIWPESFMEYAWKYSKVFPQDTKIFNIQYPINSNKNHSLPDTEALKIVEKFQSTLKSFASAGHYLVWIHLPNVFPGREGFGSDIDLFDDFVGKVREQYLQDDLYITSDHGYLKLEKNTLGYGFHLNEAIVHVPLITPRYRDNKEILFPTSHVQLGELICDSELTKRDSIYIDTKYYQQHGRKIAIIHNNFKYIYSKLGHYEELYDLDFDPKENVNLLIDRYYDWNRYRVNGLEDFVHYLKWEELRKAYADFKNERNKVWREGNSLINFLKMLNERKKELVFKLSHLFESTPQGRWGSKVPFRGSGR